MSVLFNISSKIILEGDSTEDLNYVFNDLNTDVVAAYGFRRLSPDYYGALIRVRNKNPNGDDTEKDFYPNADGKIDIDELMSYLGDSQGFLVNFYNQAVNAKTYDNPENNDGNSYAPNALQPRIVVNKILNRTNGLISAPLSQGNAVDYLKVDSGSINQITGNMFAYFVGAHDGTSGNKTMFSKNGEYEFIYTNPTTVQYSDSNNSVNLNVSASSDLRIHSFNRNTDNNTIDLQVNNTTPNPASQSIPNAITSANDSLYIGASASSNDYFLGDFQELVIFNSYKDATDKADILNKVKKYYNAY
jgi:hypothetical protein